MRLSAFIERNQETILQTWEEFARELATSPAAMPTEELRDHAMAMLDFVQRALDSPSVIHDRELLLQRFGGWQQNDTAAALHGDQRMDWRFSVRDMVAEFRALRASVIRLWSASTRRMNRDDLVTFGEAIDQALTESIDRYTSKSERQARLLQTMLSYSSDHSAIFDLNGNFIYVNRAMASTYGKHPHELEGRHVEIFDRPLAAEVSTHTKAVKQNRREVRGDFTVAVGDGEEHVVGYLFAPILGKDDEVEAIAMHARDITAQRELERTLWQHANHDHLTGVPNRRLFFDRLEQDLLLTRRLGGLLALLYIDLDKFKDANDNVGHEGGDVLLKSASQRIAACIRETDTIARMGGDEFAVILMRSGDREHVEGVARAIQSTLSRPFKIDHAQASISGSTGIALYPDDAEGATELTARADQAMYLAKTAGGNQCHFYSGDFTHGLPEALEPFSQPMGSRH